MSHNLLWRQIVLLTVGVYSSNHRVLYTIGISMTIFQKSVGPSVCNANKKAYFSFIIDSRKNNSHIRWKGLLSSTRKWDYIFNKIFFKNFTANFRKFLCLNKMPTPPSFIINSRIIICISDKKKLGIFYKKMKWYFYVSQFTVET